MLGHMIAPTEGVRAPSPEDADTDKRPERVIARPTANSRLEALHAQYEVVKQNYQAAEEKFKALKAAIQAELEDAYTGDDRPSKAYEIPASAYGPPLVVAYKTSDYLPAETVRTHFPQIWESFKKTRRFAEVRESTQGKPRGRHKK